MSRYLRAFALIAFVGVPASTALALIFGGEGNKPVRDPGWPAGAAAIFNHASRIAYWEGPPFGGGQWHAEYRGSVKELNELLASFAKVDEKTKRLIVHDGVGHSFWLNKNNEKEKAAHAQMDWAFMVWDPRSWKQLVKMSPDLRSPDIVDDKNGPPVEFDVYTGGAIRWPDVVVPRGIEVIDKRMEAHGFTSADGTVLEGNVTDVDAKKPIAARVEVQQIEPQPKSGYKYSVAANVDTDSKGHWLLKHAPAGWHRIVLHADGFVPRVIGYITADAQPSWHQYDGALAKPATVSGQVIDERGNSIANAEVQAYEVAANNERYVSPDEFHAKSNAAGHYRLTLIEGARPRISARKPGYVQPGLGERTTTPAKDIVLEMKASGTVNVTVDFGGAKRPKEYSVDLTPEGGNVVGSWGGSGNINKENKISFNDAPPGRYYVKGRPNPGSDKEETTPIKIDLKGGETKEITLHAVPPINEK